MDLPFSNVIKGQPYWVINLIAENSRINYLYFADQFSLIKFDTRYINNCKKYKNSFTSDKPLRCKLKRLSHY